MRTHSATPRYKRIQYQERLIIEPMTQNKQNKPETASGPDLTDEELIRRCLDGQPEAYRVLVDP